MQHSKCFLFSLFLFHSPCSSRFHAHWRCPAWCCSWRYHQHWIAGKEIEVHDTTKATWRCSCQTCQRWAVLWMYCAKNLLHVPKVPLAWQGTKDLAPVSKMWHVAMQRLTNRQPFPNGDLLWRTLQFAIWRNSMHPWRSKRKLPKTSQAQQREILGTSIVWMC